MSNGSFITSQLPIAPNVAVTDRLLLLWNANSNPAVGNGSPSTRTITINTFSSNIISSALTLLTQVPIKTLTFSNGNTSYTASLLDQIILVNTNTYNCTVTLPSAAANGKAYTVKKTITGSDILTTNTDSNSCSIDTAASQHTNSNFGTMSVVMGPDGNYWLTQII